MKKVLITGGAGFIGGAIVNELYKKFEVVVLDNFSPQIHGDQYKSSYLYNRIKNKCEIVQGDVRNYEDVKLASTGVNYIIHLASETGTGQSMYEINRYTDVNIMGTSNLLEALLKNNLDLKKIILASSRSVYGEGMYFCREHGVVVPNSRKDEDMRKKDFEVKCPVCGDAVELCPTTEECPLKPISYYAFTKMAQEKMIDVMCTSMNIPFTIFRYQNVFGVGQSLNNPYTGILSIFSKLLLQNQDINIFEDGLESRDFVHVSDVARISCNALLNNATDFQYINVGSGEHSSVLQIAEIMKQIYKSNSNINITGDFRKGDIRHNVADIVKAKEICEYIPEYTFKKGIEEFIRWVKEQELENWIEDQERSYLTSLTEMENKGMFIKGNNL